MDYLNIKHNQQLCVVPAINRFTEKSNAALAISLHAPNQKLREEIMPKIAKKHHLEELMHSCKTYIKKHKNRFITFEYILLAKVNDSTSHAKELAILIKDIPNKVNLIPYNPIEGENFTKPDKSRIDNFVNVLKSQGLLVTVRKTRGDDISAACGMLAGIVKDKSNRVKSINYS